jgi:iron(III) transport system substrate-binding protein
MKENMNIPLRTLYVVVLLMTSLHALPVIAQSSKELAALAAYDGADRERRLLEGAKKEGELTLYGSIPVPDLTAITSAFEKKYGLKVKLWRSSSENVLQRMTTEARAGQPEVDVVETSAQAIESLPREQLLQRVSSPYTRDQTVRRHLR